MPKVRRPHAHPRGRRHPRRRRPRAPRCPRAAAPATARTARAPSLTRAAHGDALDLVRPRDPAGRDGPGIRAVRHPPAFAIEPPTVRPWCPRPPLRRHPRPLPTQPLLGIPTSKHLSAREWRAIQAADRGGRRRRLRDPHARPRAGSSAPRPNAREPPAAPRGRGSAPRSRPGCSRPQSNSSAVGRTFVHPSTTFPAGPQGPSTSTTDGIAHGVLATLATLRPPCAALNARKVCCRRVAGIT